MSVCHEIGEARTQETNLDPVHFTPMKKPVIICSNHHIFDRATHQEIIDKDAASPCPLCRAVVFPIPQPAPWQKRVAYKIADILTGEKQIIVLSGKIICACAATAWVVVPSVKVIIQKAYQPGYLASFIRSPIPENSYYDSSQKVKVVVLTAVFAAGCCLSLGAMAKAAWNRR